MARYLIKKIKEGDIEIPRDGEYKRFYFNNITRELFWGTIDIKNRVVTINKEHFPSEDVMGDGVRVIGRQEFFLLMGSSRNKLALVPSHLKELAA